MKTLPLVKCTITSEYFEETDVTRSIDDWESLEVVLSRDKTSGVSAEVSFPINLVLRARALVKAIFEKDGLYAKAKFNVYQRGDRDNNYTLVKSMLMDFGTYKEYDNRVTIEAAEAELVELVNSEGKTKYEIAVSEVADVKKWEYRRMEFLSYGKYVPTNNSTNVQATSAIIPFPLTREKHEVVPGTGAGFMTQGTNRDSYFFETLNNDIRLEVDVKMTVTMISDFVDLSGGGAWEEEIKKNVQVAFLFFIGDKHLPIPVDYKLTVKDIKVSTVQSWRSTHVFEINYHGFIDVAAGGKLKFGFYILRGSAINPTIQIADFGIFNTKFNSTSSNVKNIDVINPQVLMQKYLDNMSGVAGLFKASIEWQEKDYKTMIVAAESIRNIPNAKLYGSPKDFFEWMKVLGYEFEYIDKGLIFKPRDKFFRKDVTAMNLKAKELADLIVQADETHAYTSVEIGYDKQDFETLNGRCEANGTFCYTTGYITRADNKLSLISPFRADSIGIELLCQEVDRDTTDNKSDNDVFFVAMTENSGNYVEYRRMEIGDSQIGLKMFNAPFNPYFLVQRNASLIGINTTKIKFKSTDMSRTATIEGVGGVKDIYADQSITKKLFDPIEYNFAAGCNQKIPPESLRNGLIYFEWQGKTLKGFIKKVRKNYGTPTETTWILWAVK